MLLDGSSALGAVIAAYFSAIGRESGVLMSPMSLMTAGVAAGTRAFDGRLRQPGIGGKRPRGFRNGETIPAAAFIAAPTGVHAALVALAYDRESTLSRILRAANKSLRDVAPSPRLRLLERVAQAGAHALAESTFAHPLLAVASPSEGGVLTMADLNAVPEVDHAARVSVSRNENDKTRVSGEVVLGAPWENMGSEGRSERHEIVLAVDGRGGFAALDYVCAEAGVMIEELGLMAPRAAVPVLRGVPRVAPGTFLSATSGIAIHTDASGTPFGASGAFIDRTRSVSRAWGLYKVPGARRIEIARS
jgi:gamma-glutamyltranspeptidase/glutathione hydrolase